MNIKSFIFGVVVGGCASGVATYFITKKKVEHDATVTANKKAEEVILQMRNYYEEKYTIQKAEVLKDKEDPSEIVKKYSAEDIQEYHGFAERYSGGAVDPAETERPSEDDNDAPDEYYEESAEPGPDPEEVDAVAQGMLADVYEKLNHGKPPEIISEEEFGQAPGFDHKECIYYVEDLTFCNDEEEIIDDEIRAFGPDVEEWARNSDIKDPFIVRNYDYSCDYRIEKYYCKCPLIP